MSSKSKKRPSYPMTLTKAVSHALVIFLWAFCAAFSPSPEAFDRLKAEVERLKNAYKQCAWERDIFAEDMTQEIKKDCSYLMLDIKTIKAEAYKEFADNIERAFSKTESQMPNSEVIKQTVQICRNAIRIALNELVGDTSAGKNK